ncbi:MAG: type II toxin-antitoxin system VapC family toxin [Geminicoccaceae bacterium]|nr:type II toxin-antitoxin system VapC family toxin [Geminicoccaceae bacterium]
MRIVVATSVLFAMSNSEPEAGYFHSMMLRHEPLISSGSMIETVRVIQMRFGDHGLGALDQLTAAYGLELVPVTPESVAWARHGMLRYGKGRRKEPAVLNFGDLFAYAAAKALDLPLLFKGGDFSKTDVRPVELGI